MKRLFLITALSAYLLGALPVAGQPPTTPYSPEHPLDLNNATYEQIARLPIPRELAERIYDRIEYQGPFTSVYQLREVEGMTQELLLQLKPLVRIEPFEEKSEREERIEQLYYRLDRWEGDEGTNQALIDFWIEQALDPIPINEVRYDQLLNLSGVSPVDAAAIINYRRQVGQIGSLRDLRSAPYLSYFGYRNTRNFITFEQPERKRELHGHLMFRMTDTPFFTEEADVTATLDQNTLSIGTETPNQYPDIYTRFIGSYGPDIKLGFSYWHALQEPILNTDLGFIRLPRAKMYLGLLDKPLWGKLRLRKLYLGNYSLAFGQGVVMENTDFFVPRKSGFGFRKRFMGLTGDNSRTREYKLTGAAAELAYGDRAHLFLFGSFDKRDAILNRTPVIINGEAVHPVSQFIVLDQRFQFAPDDSTRDGTFPGNPVLPWRDSVRELLYGFHAAYDVFPTTQLGITYYESAYDRPLRPPSTPDELGEIVAPENLNQIDLPDNEIFNAYGGPISDGKNPFWSAAKSFRRVYGIDFQSVFQNISLQGEYAELDKGRSVSLFGLTGENPWAFVGSAYVQFDNFNILGLYRNYHLEFDNPYQRSFSNYQRYKRTIFEDFFYLESPFYTQLFTNNPQPQAEEGFYFNTRYQFSRKFVLTLEYDNWKRKADDVTQFRLRGTLQFRPIFPITVNLRQKYQGREAQNNQTVEYFENLEFRGTVRFRLSRFDELGILYSTSVVKFRPRPRFFFPTEPGEELRFVNLAGNAALPGEAIGGFYTHNFNRWLKIRGFAGYYNGFFWNFEDTQFFVMESTRGAMRYWVSLYSRISNRITMRLKYTRDRQFRITSLQARGSDNQPIGPGHPNFQPGKYYRADLVQPDQEFYYMEININF